MFRHLKVSRLLASLAVLPLLAAPVLAAERAGQTPPAPTQAGQSVVSVANSAYPNGFAWSAAPAPTGLPGNFPRLDQTAIQAGEARAVPIDRPSVSTGPIVTYAAPTSGQPGYTPTAIAAMISSYSVINPVFTYDYLPAEQSGVTYPYYTTTTQRSDGAYASAFANQPGIVAVSFVSDAPAVTFYGSSGNAARVTVDNAEICKVAALDTSGTAQSGTASTIVLQSSGSSTVSNYYAGRYVTIISGTGAGQSRIINSYVGSTTLTATIGPAWATSPDNTSVYNISAAPYVFQGTTGFGGVINVNWSGERRLRTYHFVSSGYFTGINVTSAIDTVTPSQKHASPVCVVAGDSYFAGTGADTNDDSMAARFCNAFDLEWLPASTGGTGWVAPGSFSANSPDSLPYGDRIVPPVNAWLFNPGGSTSFTFSQGGITTATIGNPGGTPTVIQSALDTAFGAGNFTVYTNSGYYYYILGRGSYASTASLTVTGSNGTPALTHWFGTMAPYLPKDGNGNYLPFYILWGGSHNDTSYTASQITAAVSAAATTFTQRYPMGTQLFMGYDGLLQSSPATDEAEYAGVAASAPRISGKVAYIESKGDQTIQSGSIAWFNGAGYWTNPKGDGNNDIAAFNDGIHPSYYGHWLYAVNMAREINRLFAGN